MSGVAIEADRPLTDERIAEQLAQLGPADDAPVKDAQPRKRRASSRRKPAAAAAGDGEAKPTRPRSRSGTRKPAVNIKAGLTQLYTMAGLGVGMVPSEGAQAVGLALAAQAEQCATAWDQLAKENPRVKRALEQLLTVSSVGVLVAAHAPIVLAGLAATGKLDGMAGGVAAVPSWRANVAEAVGEPEAAQAS